MQAGHNVTQATNSVVAVGIASSEYNNYVVPRFNGGVSAYSATGGALSVASGRLSYTFAFKGPALSVDTACSSSLVATHVAVSNIWSHAAHGGLAAGVGLLLSPDTTAMFQKAGMLAADGRCKSMDAAADGYVRGEASGVLRLQELSPGSTAAGQAIAVFRTSAVNQDGRSSSLTAPNGPSQQEVIRTALQLGGLRAADISHVQLHGTGTPLGDPIELGAAAAVLVDGASRALPLANSTAKSWIGHMEAAAGIMGLTHAAMGLSHQLTQGKVSYRKLKSISEHCLDRQHLCAGILHLSSVNPHVATILDISHSKVGRVGAHLPRHSSGAVAGLQTATGISSFAFQGTNAHAILQNSQEATVVASSKLDLWTKQRVWVAPAMHLLLQRLVPGKGQRQRQLTFEASLNTPQLAFFREHVVSGTVMFPASAFIETAFGAVRMLSLAADPSSAAISGAVFVTPLAIPAHDVPIKVGASPD